MKKLLPWLIAGALAILFYWFWNSKYSYQASLRKVNNFYECVDAGGVSRVSKNHNNNGVLYIPAVICEYKGKEYTLYPQSM